MSDRVHLEQKEEFVRAVALNKVAVKAINEYIKINKDAKFMSNEKVSMWQEVLRLAELSKMIKSSEYPGKHICINNDSKDLIYALEVLTYGYITNAYAKAHVDIAKIRPLTLIYQLRDGEPPYRALENLTRLVLIIVRLRIRLKGVIVIYNGKISNFNIFRTKLASGYKEVVNDYVGNDMFKEIEIWLHDWEYLITRASIWDDYTIIIDNTVRSAKNVNKLLKWAEERGVSEYYIPIDHAYSNPFSGDPYNSREVTHPSVMSSGRGTYVFCYPTTDSVLLNPTVLQAYRVLDSDIVSMFSSVMGCMECVKWIPNMNSWSKKMTYCSRAYAVIIYLEVLAHGMAVLRLHFDKVFIPIGLRVMMKVIDESYQYDYQDNQDKKSLKDEYATYSSFLEGGKFRIGRNAKNKHVRRFNDLDY